MLWVFRFCLFDVCSLGMECLQVVGSPPESQPLEILQSAGKDGGGWHGGWQGYGYVGGWNLDGMGSCMRRGIKMLVCVLVLVVMVVLAVALVWMVLIVWVVVGVLAVVAATVIVQSIGGSWLCGSGFWVVEEMMAWVVEGLDGGFVTGSPGFAESSGKTSQTVFHSFSISTTMCFWSAWKGKVVNIVEMFTGKCVEVWDNLRLDPYSNGRLLYILEMGIESWWGREAWGDACRVRVFLVPKNGLLLPQGQSKLQHCFSG